jgi:hypothetical protein
MRCIADFEVLSDFCIADDTKKLKLRHPTGHYEVHIKNGPKPQPPALPHLSVQVIFDSPDLSTAKGDSREHLFDALNMLAFVTNSRFEYHRLLKIIDWTPGITMREALIFTGFDPATDPEPMLNDALVDSAQKLLETESAPAMKRALRWFRLGLAGESPEETFQYFWFALEIVAEGQKSPAKVHDRCPKCQGNLYCESCKEYPTHRPYAKQAIRQLINEIIEEDADKIFGVLDKARNALMHGARLKDVEEALNVSSEHLVDILGRVAWRSLLRLLPPNVELMNTELAMAEPTSYVRRRMTYSAHIITVVPTGADGEPDIERFPTKISFERMRRVPQTDPR